MLITEDCVVSIHYTLSDQAGDVLDSSEGKEPLHYLQGASNIIPGLENELTGKAIGDSLKVTVAPGDGYGERQEQLNHGCVVVAATESKHHEHGKGDDKHHLNNEYQREYYSHKRNHSRLANKLSK